MIGEKEYILGYFKKGRYNNLIAEKENGTLKKIRQVTLMLEPMLALKVGTNRGALGTNSLQYIRQ